MSQPTPTQTPSASPTLSPGDHARLLIELLRPNGAELGRRWLASLLAVPQPGREATVRAIERRVAELYPPGDTIPAATEGARRLDVRHAPVQHEGYIEQKVTTYEVVPETADATIDERGHGLERSADTG